MNPVFDTVAAFLDRYAAEVFAWIEFGLLPVLVPALIAVARRRALRGKGAYVWPTAARILGGASLFAVLVVVPWVVFEIWFVPVILDAHPASRSLVNVLEAPADWMVRESLCMYLLVAVLWPAWVVSAAISGFRRMIRGGTPVA